MDGNRRWAEKRNLQRHAGHEFGFFQLKECLKWCLDLGIRVVTVYAFSIENFKRPSTEVDTLMRLAAEKLVELVEEQGFLQRNNIRVQVLGDLDLLPAHVQHKAAEAMRVSRHHDRAVLNICMAYTAREEMLTAVREVAGAAGRGELRESDVTEELLSSVLYTAPHSQARPSTLEGARNQHCHARLHAGEGRPSFRQLPKGYLFLLSAHALPPFRRCASSGRAAGAAAGQVDLLVRTSGETRLSDFLLWQARGGGKGGGGAGGGMGWVGGWGGGENLGQARSTIVSSFSFSFSLSSFSFSLLILLLVVLVVIIAWVGDASPLWQSDICIRV